jgi:uncharacterized metal-binding protein
MPDARTHDLITVVSGVAMLPPLYTYLLNLDAENAAGRAALLVGAHLLSGMLFSPDLDLDSAIDDRWGWFAWIWKPYTWLIPHRHFWSHGLVLPPILRLGYMLAVFLLMLFCLARFFAAIGLVIPDYHVRLAQALTRAVQEHPTETLLILLGFVTGGAAHTIADWLVTGGKRYLAMIGIRTRRSYTNHDRSIHRLRRF